jgi:hypothetical protein
MPDEDVCTFLTGGAQSVHVATVHSEVLVIDISKRGAGFQEGLTPLDGEDVRVFHERQNVLTHDVLVCLEEDLLRCERLL